MVQTLNVFAMFYSFEDTSPLLLNYPKAIANAVTVPADTNSPALDVAVPDTVRFPAPESCIFEAGASVPLALVLKSIREVPVPSPPPEDNVKLPPLIFAEPVAEEPAATVNALPAVVLVVGTIPISQAAAFENVTPPSSMSKISVPSTSKRIFPASYSLPAVAVDISK
jgi:hypothetical protein